LVDQAELAGGTVAERLHLPFVTAIVTLPFTRDPSVPFFCYHDVTSRGVVARARNTRGNSRVERLGARNRAQINEARRSWRLPPRRRDEDFYSSLAQITQVPREFDFPERTLPPTFYYAGPFLDPNGRRALDFPWERVDPTRPLVFVSMGTLQNGVERVFRLVAEACADLRVQLVISLGGGLSPAGLGASSGSPLVVDYAPQLELLRKAALTIFHGGLNTALESLAHGVPMVALPVTIDQPGVGARIKRTHTRHVNPRPAPLDGLFARGHRQGLDGSKLPAKRPALSTPNRSGERR
jgi:zeaxanthin glucosyltransferase